MEKFAVIDCGTNTFHLLVVSVDEGSVKEEYRLQIPVKLGEGGINTGIIMPEPYKRGIAALMEFARKLHEHRVISTTAFATSAIRSARNGKEFLDDALELTGIEIQPISGKEEAQYIFSGVSHAYPMTEENALVMDIGGGSVEFIIGNNEGIKWAHSFDLGAARLVEKFHTIDPMPAENVQQLNEFLERQLHLLEKGLHEFPAKILIGSAGSFDSICELINARFGDHLLKNEISCEIDLGKYAEIHQTLLTSSMDERKAMPGLADYRVEMMVVASCLINFVLKHFGLQKMYCSTYSLKEGVVFDVISKN